MVERMGVLSGLAAKAVGSETVGLAALPPATRLSVRVSTDPTALEAALGVVMPREACRASVHGDRAALWLGPDEVLFIAPDGLASALMTATEGQSVVDISHRNVGIEVSGPFAVLALNAFCALDLSEATFPIGMCTRTLLGKAEVVLWRTGTETFRVEVWRSVAPYVWRCLEEARLEFLAG